MQTTLENKEREVSSKFNLLCDKMIGKKLRNRSKIVIGEVVDVIHVHDGYWNSNRFFAIIDDGSRVDITYVKVG